MQVLTGEPPAQRTKVYLEEVAAGGGESGDALTGVEVRVGGDFTPHHHAHHTSTSHIQVVAGPDQDHSHYTHVTHLPQAQVRTTNYRPSPNITTFIIIHYHIFLLFLRQFF